MRKRGLQYSQGVADREKMKKKEMFCGKLHVLSPFQSKLNWERDRSFQSGNPNHCLEVVTVVAGDAVSSAIFSSLELDSGICNLSGTIRSRPDLHQP
ncbi:hypothetical protein MPTK1_8g12670 [Marchantia polymorpha subsp. ruderalis]|uniref:Uncharacterized protein n=1 Tax=Marchantia polymorpha TaxID=3197 RepID=A0A2R6WJQ4_MARPO|nr:hypothetical protein MARPO_0083s0053 [Marchantia polymorpha]BBN19677.1 hypothetical protein Mp_8g12670 [Marchantia polymorpha subsp. ruderalis]|eukprot:PTQ34090.1 hypothetical protein MARPO_0083s0053 [Marchantia polymorpha]